MESEIYVKRMHSLFVRENTWLVAPSPDNQSSIFFDISTIISNIIFEIFIWWGLSWHEQEHIDYQMWQILKRFSGAFCQAQTLKLDFILLIDDLACWGLKWHNNSMLFIFEKAIFKKIQENTSHWFFSYDDETSLEKI